MNRRTVLSVVTAALTAALLVGCEPTWIVHSRATPDPFLNKRDFVVLPIAYAGLRVGMQSEEAYLADKGPMEQQAFYKYKAALNDAFVYSVTQAALAEGIHVVHMTKPLPGAFLIQPSVTSIDPGAGSQWPSDVRMLMRLSTMEGRVLDTVEMTNRTSAYTALERLRNDGTELGKTAAAYLKTRVIPGAT
jgi:hypothetical protein